MELAKRIGMIYCERIQDASCVGCAKCYKSVNENTFAFEDQGDVRVVFKTMDGSQPSLSGDGPWAWFRILDRSEVERVTSDRLVVTFAVAGHQARYEIRASSVVNPFMMKQLQQFRCPEGL